MRPIRNRARRYCGFTLLEMLVAVALMAIVALMSWRAMQAVIDGRDRITLAANEMRALSTAFTQMDEDLRRSWPVRLFNLPQRPIMFLPGASQNDPLMLVLERESVASEALQIQQVVYRLRNDVFERGFSPWSGTSFTEVRLDDLIWQPLINGVQSIAFRAWVPGAGWLSGEGLVDLGDKPRPVKVANQPDPVYDGPVGVEITIDRGGNSLQRLFAVED